MACDVSPVAMFLDKHRFVESCTDGCFSVMLLFAHSWKECKILKSKICKKNSLTLRYKLQLLHGRNLIFSFCLLSINRSSCCLRILSTLYGIPSKERGDWIIPEKIWLYSNKLFQKVQKYVQLEILKDEGLKHPIS